MFPVRGEAAVVHFRERRVLKLLRVVKKAHGAGARPFRNST
jgi:hypothetical protein